MARRRLETVSLRAFFDQRRLVEFDLSLAGADLDYCGFGLERISDLDLNGFRIWT